MERQAILEIDTNSFKRNVESIKNYLNNQEIMPIIKANGYGTYINKRLDLIKDFNIVGVAIVKEGKAIKTKDVTILVLLETSLQYLKMKTITVSNFVTILVLLETSLQFYQRNSLGEIVLPSQSLFYWKLLCNRFSSWL